MRHDLVSSPQDGTTVCLLYTSIIYVQEHGFDTQSDLKNTLLAAKQELKEMQTQFAQHRSNLRTLNDQIRYTGDRKSTRLNSSH